MIRALRTTSLQKDYPAPSGEGLQTVLGPISFEVAAGSVVGIVGENGAGKSTLLRLIAGLDPPTSGSIEVSAWPIGMVHQHFSLVPSLTATENVWLGDEPRRFGLFDRQTASAKTTQLAERLFKSAEPELPIEELPIAGQQRVELLKALRQDAPTVLLDEPTAVLLPNETNALLATLSTLKARGRTILIVSHKLREIASVCERILVVRRGLLVLDAKLPETSLDVVAQAMIGDAPHPSRSDAAEGPLSRRPEGAQHHRAGEGWGEGAIVRLLGFGAPLQVAPGEIRGIAGVSGNGQEELFETLVGLRPTASLELFGQPAGHLSVRERRALGIRCVPADRGRCALLQNASLFDNLRLGNPTLNSAEAEALLIEYDVRPPLLFASARSLSGGNQQKLLLARELYLRRLHPPGPPGPFLAGGRLFVVHEPSRGIDWHAQARIWEALRARADQGAAVVVLSSDLDELQANARNLQIIYRGLLSEPIEPHASASDIGALMAGL